MSDESENKGESENTVTIAAFNDPMQGLVWEMEPVWQELRERYGMAAMEGDAR